MKIFSFHRSFIFTYNYYYMNDQYLSILCLLLKHCMVSQIPDNVQRNRPPLVIRCILNCLGATSAMCPYQRETW